MDIGIMGLLLRPDDDEAVSCSLSGIQQFSETSGFQVEVGGLDSLGFGHRTAEPYATCLPVPGHLGNAIRRPMPG